MDRIENCKRFLPVLIETFVRNVKHDNGKGMKLPKIHQLRHFIPQIYKFGSANNITGQIRECNLQEKVKCPSE